MYRVCEWHIELELPYKEPVCPSNLFLCKAACLCHLVQCPRNIVGPANCIKHSCNNRFNEPSSYESFLDGLPIKQSRCLNELFGDVQIRRNPPELCQGY